jgi:hypothetical protein
MPRGRPKKLLDNEESLQKQIKNHQYYLKFKSNHPDYYKKIKKVENVDDDVPKENVELNKKNELLNKIDNIIQSLNALKKLF